MISSATSGTREDCDDGFRAETKTEAADEEEVKEGRSWLTEEALRMRGARNDAGLRWDLPRLLFLGTEKDRYWSSVGFGLGFGFWSQFGMESELGSKKRLGLGFWLGAKGKGGNWGGGSITLTNLI